MKSLNLVRLRNRISNRKRERISSYRERQRESTSALGKGREREIGERENCNNDVINSNIVAAVLDL